MRTSADERTAKRAERAAAAISRAPQRRATRILADVEQERSAATAAANQAEQLMQNQYVAGQVSYADVISTQTAALSARQASVNAALDRQTAAIALMQAIGGYW